MDNLTETLADIEALAARVSWELMDEAQRDDLMERIVMPRWGKTTADGVTLKGTAWAKLLGTTEPTIKSRYQRIAKKASEQDESASALQPAPNQRASIRSAKAAIRAHPELAKDLVEDPEVGQSVKQAVDEHRATSARQRPESPEPRFPVSDLSDEMEVRRHIRNAKAEIRDAIVLARDVSYDDDGTEAASTEIRLLLTEVGLLTEAIGADSLDDELRTLTGDNR